MLEWRVMFGGKPVITDEKRIDELLSRGVAEVIHKESLKKKLMSGKRLRVKLGIDPTSPNLHIGRSIPLLKLKDFQDLGHQVVFIIGDATGVIGDTSDKESERPMLTAGEVKRNAKSYFDQAALILGKGFEKRYNSEWLNDLSFNDLGKLADQFSVADFIARDNIRRRLEGGTRVSLRETLYPLMQGYDSVAVEADVELGGTDQRFNLLAGRTLQEFYDQAPQDIVMTDLIEGFDGQKMSSSIGNTTNFTDDAADMYGKVMRTPDSLVETYFTHCTRVTLDEVHTLVNGHPKEAKMKLAKEIVSMYHNKHIAEKAEAAFSRTFSDGGIPEDLPTEAVADDELLVDVLMRKGMISSKTDFRRHVEQGAITYTDTDSKITNADEKAKPGTYKIGKRRFLKIHK